MLFLLASLSIGLWENTAHAVPCWKHLVGKTGIEEVLEIQHLRSTLRLHLQLRALPAPALARFELRDLIPLHEIDYVHAKPKLEDRVRAATDQRPAEVWTLAASSEVQPSYRPITTARLSDGSVVVIDGNSRTQALRVSLGSSTALQVETQHYARLSAAAERTIREIMERRNFLIPDSTEREPGELDRLTQYDRETWIQLVERVLSRSEGWEFFLGNQVRPLYWSMPPPLKAELLSRIGARYRRLPKASTSWLPRVWFRGQTPPRLNADLIISHLLGPDELIAQSVREGDSPVQALQKWFDSQSRALGIRVDYTAEDLVRLASRLVPRDPSHRLWITGSYPNGRADVGRADLDVRSETLDSSVGDRKWDDLIRALEPRFWHPTFLSIDRLRGTLMIPRQFLSSPLWLEVGPRGVDLWVYRVSTVSRPMPLFGPHDHFDRYRVDRPESFR